MTKIQTTQIRRKGTVLGWKVYIDGKKYPPKPRDYYANLTEERAVLLAFVDAGRDVRETQDVVWKCC